MTDAESTHGEENASPGGAGTVPTWLAVAVLVLLMVAFTLAGFVIRGFVRDGEGDDEGLDSAERAVLEAPDSVQAHLELAFEHQNAGRYDEALAEYERVLASDPGNLEAMFQRGRVFLAAGDEAAAEEAFWDVLEASPGHASAAKALAEFYGANAEYRSMLVALEEASRLNPTVVDLHYLRGLAYEKLGRLDEARAAYEQALEYAPDFVEAHEGLERVGGP